MEPLALGWVIGSACGIFVSFMLLRAIHPAGRPQRNRVVPRALVDDSDWDPIFGRPVSDWQSKFAWRPVRTIDEDLIWLRRYWRRRIHKKEFLHGGDDFWFQRVVTLRYLVR